jgi:hypothetical protein
MYEKGGPVAPIDRTPTNENAEVSAGDIIEMQVHYSCLIDLYIATPHKTVADVEREYAERYWAKVVEEGHQPLYVKTWVYNVESRQFREWTEVRGVVAIQAVWKALHASPLAITIAVTWAVVVLAIIVVAYLTSPYWGPLFWRWAGYKPGEAPPSPSAAPGLEWVVYILIGLGIIAVLPTILSYIRAREKAKE